MRESRVLLNNADVLYVFFLRCVGPCPLSYEGAAVCYCVLLVPSSLYCLPLSRGYVLCCCLLSAVSGCFWAPQLLGLSAALSAVWEVRESG